MPPGAPDYLGCEVSYFGGSENCRLMVTVGCLPFISAGKVKREAAAESLSPKLTDRGGNSLMFSLTDRRPAEGLVQDNVQANSHGPQAGYVCSSVFCLVIFFNQALMS